MVKGEIFNNHEGFILIIWFTSLNLMISGCASFEWAKAQRLDSIEGYEAYLIKNKSKMSSDEVMRVSYVIAKKSNIIESYKTYFRNFPNGYYTAADKNYLLELEYEKAIQEDDLELYKTYLDDLKLYATSSSLFTKNDKIKIIKDKVLKHLSSNGYIKITTYSDIKKIESNLWNSSILQLLTGKYKPYLYDFDKNKLFNYEETNKIDDEILKNTSTEIKIKANYNANLRYYYPEGSDPVWTQASVSGDIELYIGGIQVDIKRSFKGAYALERITDEGRKWYSKEENAPYWFAVSKSNFIEEFANLLTSIRNYNNINGGNPILLYFENAGF